jgi:uncharacterized RDD family membrane protein YckC
MEDATYLPRLCPRCGNALKDDAPEGLCASCLLAAATETLTHATMDEALTVTSRGVPAASPLDMPQLSTGQTWGPYRIGRLLGRGGMGEVHEAEHADSGRRIALKVLRSRLQDADDRARFLREGQLAASVSHPHTVYIFGSEEISGVPVISMELLPGGTLKDRVTAEGPLPPPVAVSAVLDIIGGLDAAQAVGILHRDIKPSNCFVDSDGSVKVGDFGLSISTLARDVREQLATGFEGTPLFAAPEQLRGEPLDVRADIYAVGATLYYLLTGRPPFDAPDLRALYTHVTADAPASPRRGHPEIPPQLAALVVQCLAKSPADRPASYAALADALRPFTTATDTPARPGPRFVAAAADTAILAVPITVWMMLASDPVSGPANATTALGRWTWLASFAYYLVTETVWGASLGKRLMGLRVAAIDGSPAGWWRIVLRTSMCFAANPLVTATALATSASLVETLRTPILLGFAAVLFATARRRNGWAAVHDRVSGTRVVSRAAAQSVRAGNDFEATAPPHPTHSVAARQFGPFAAFSEPVHAGDDQLAIAFDPILRREVWIHIVPPQAPPVTAARRDVSRIGRLHWLTGRRRAGERWDAYEAPGGAPFLAHPPAGWPTVKQWLTDLATELAASERDGSTPALLLDRLWIRRDGHLVLLDFRAPGLSAVPSASHEPLTPLALLSAVVLRALRQDAGPGALPLSARALFARWGAAPDTPLAEAVAGLARVTAAHDRVRPWRRAVPIALASGPLAAILVAAVLLLPPLFRFAANSQTMEIIAVMQALSETTRRPGSRFADPEIRDAAERYLVGRHGAVLRDDAFWSQNLIQSSFATMRPRARDILARHPSVSSSELAQAAALIAPELAVWARRARRSGRGSMVEAAGIIISTLSAAALVTALLCGIASSAIAPGGIVLRQLGHAVVTRDGRQIGRMRTLQRIGISFQTPRLCL